MTDPAGYRDRLPSHASRLPSFFVALVALVVVVAVPMAAAVAPDPPDEATVYMPAYLDTPPGSPFAADIRTFSAEGITRGCDAAGRFFCPDDDVSRGQMAAFLVRALGFETGDDTPVFLDTADTVYHAVIGELAAAGVTKGCNPPANDLFCPGRSVTRGEMAAFLVRALDLDGPLPKDWATRFIDDDGSVFEADIARLAAAGITNGCNRPANDRYCPGEPVSRQQMAAFLVRALGLEKVPVHPPTVTVKRQASDGAPGSTLTVCHREGATATRVRNAGWGGAYPRVATDVVPSVMERSLGSYDAVTDVWTTDPAVECATFETGWNPKDVGLEWPLPELRITSHFGYRYHPILGGRRLHRGTDFGAPSGTEVRAAAAGRVVTAGTDGAFGATVGISHAAGLTTRYSHLSSVSVGVGDTVAIGDVVGEVGCTGRCTGPHLHFETWEWGIPVDPMSYLG